MQSHSGGKRLDGWKAISGYFKRDRSTVMRWAQERALPIHRLPGGKQGSVFALEHELAAWELDRGQDDPGDPQAAPDIAPKPRRTLWLRRLAVAMALVAGALLWVALARLPDRAGAETNRLEMPANRDAAADYLAARDSWARRTPKDIGRAITLYQEVIAAEPGFAPAYAGLAEAWLIFREYGEIGDLEAYNAAHTAALRALQLDANLPAAHRAMGFIHYWRENDAPRAIAAFKRAIALDDTDSQTHFWYANILADIGDHEMARRQYDRARLLSPGSQVIEVEAACAEWQAGRDAIAVKRLTALAARYPDDATVHNCLAWLHIGQGDIAAFGKDYAAVARSRNEPELLRLARELDAAIGSDPKMAHRILTAHMRREISTGERRGRETPAFYASAMGDREELVSLMKEARGTGEVWYSSSITSRMARHWRGDREIEALLDILRAPRTNTNS